MKTVYCSSRGAKFTSQNTSEDSNHLLGTDTQILWSPQISKQRYTCTQRGGRREGEGDGEGERDRQREGKTEGRREEGRGTGRGREMHTYTHSLK